MSKFLKLVAENRPLAAHELNKATPIKRIFHRALLSDSSKAILEDIGLKDIQVTNTSDDIILKFNDGTVITYSVEVVKEEDENVTLSASEDVASEDPKGLIATKLNKVKEKIKRVKPILPRSLDKMEAKLDAVVNNI
jgi:hypothetical protein